MIEVLIVDDHAVVRDGIASVLDASGAVKVTGVADCGAEAVGLVRAKRFDVALLDISMPGMNGLETLKQIHIEHPSLPVVMLSLYPEEQYAMRCIKAGASGYLST
jgi:two-component system, NarL family, invasion response regulator UvrY